MLVSNCSGPNLQDYRLEPLCLAIKTYFFKKPKVTRKMLLNEERFHKIKFCSKGLFHNKKEWGQIPKSSKKLQ
jgi:hypothetical protein